MGISEQGHWEQGPRLMPAERLLLFGTSHTGKTPSPFSLGKLWLWQPGSGRCPGWENSEHPGRLPETQQTRPTNEKTELATGAQDPPPRKNKTSA